MTAWRALVVSFLAIVVLFGGATWYALVATRAESRIQLRYPEGVAAAVPLGISVGKSPISGDIPNPLAGDPSAVQHGKQYFRSLNCASCHGYKGTGGMGPDLTDAGWLYGGRPIDVYKSIYEGRPKGMPAWGNAIPPQTIWQLVAYVQSFGATTPPAQVKDKEDNVAAGAPSSLEEGGPQEQQQQAPPPKPDNSQQPDPQQQEGGQSQ